MSASANFISCLAVKRNKMQEPMSKLQCQTFVLKRDNFPRVRYFRDRYRNVFLRFRNLMGLLPSCFDDNTLMSDLQSFYTDLERPPYVMVDSNKELALTDLIIKASQEQPEVEKSRGSKIEKASVSASQEQPEVEKSRGSKIEKASVSASQEQPEVEKSRGSKIDKASVSASKEQTEVEKSRESRNDQASFSLYVADFIETSFGLALFIREMIWPDALILNTDEPMAKEEVCRVEDGLDYLVKVQHQNPDTKTKVLNVCKSDSKELSTTISRILEERIIGRFVSMFTHLKQFVRQDRRYDLANVDVLYSSEITKAIHRAIFENRSHDKKDDIGGYADAELGDQVDSCSDIGRKPEAHLKTLPKAPSPYLTAIYEYDYPLIQMRQKSIENAQKSERSISRTVSNDGSRPRSNMIKELCQSMLSSAVVTLAAKHNLQESDCYKILQEIQFNNRLVESFVENGTDLIINKYHTDRDDIVEHVQSTAADMFNKTELILGKMGKLVTVMRKMGFEIKGYLSQSNIATSLYDDIFLNRPLPADVRKQILSIDGVLSVATVYGEPEIGILAESVGTSVEQCQEKLKIVLKECKYSHPYQIKIVESVPKPLAGGTVSRFEQGDEIRFQDPCKVDELRVGTLGLCVEGNDGNTYGLTCAHVVENPNHVGEIEVNILKSCEAQPTKFGSVSEDLVAIRHEGNIRTIDIAAIKVHEVSKDRCDFTVLNDKAKHKTAVLSCFENNDDLVGKLVYKYGAKTKYTEGIIRSSDCFFVNMDYVFVLIENLPSSEVDFDDGIDLHEVDSDRNDSLRKSKLFIKIESMSEISSREKGETSTDCGKHCNEGQHDSGLGESFEFGHKKFDVAGMEQELACSGLPVGSNEMAPNIELDKLNQVTHTEMKTDGSFNASISMTEPKPAIVFGDNDDSGFEPNIDNERNASLSMTEPITVPEFEQKIDSETNAPMFMAEQVFASRCEFGAASNASLPMAEPINVPILGEEDARKAGFGDKSDIATGFGEKSDIAAGFGEKSDIAAGSGKNSDIAAGFGEKSDLAAGSGEMSDIAAGFGEMSDIAAGFGEMSENAAGFGEKSGTRRIFGDEGDSGAVVCMTDINTDSVLVVSMISAGDNTSSDPVVFSIPMERQLAELTKHMARQKPGFHFKLAERK